jgi:hypothetical protein
MQQHPHCVDELPPGISGIRLAAALLPYGLRHRQYDSIARWFAVLAADNSELTRTMLRFWKPNVTRIHLRVVAALIWQLSKAATAKDCDRRHRVWRCYNRNFTEFALRCCAYTLRLTWSLAQKG